MAKLTNLTSLDLRGNNLSELPESVAKLTNLTSLDLELNKLSELPESVGKLTNLTSLDLSRNNLSELPESVAKLTKLTSLDLELNKLSELPESVAKLTNLTSLDLSSNNLSELPESVGKLTNLTSLDLSSNNLSELPESVAKLTNLTSLDLSSNNLSELPESVGKLTNLTSLHLRGNRFPNPLASISLWGGKYTAKYLRNQLGRGQKILLWFQPFDERSISFWAVTETLLVSMLSIYLFATYPQILVISLCIAPLLLFRTKHSSKLALKKFATLSKRHNPKQESGQSILFVLLKAIRLFAGSVVIKVCVTCHIFWKRPHNTLLAFPENYLNSLSKVSIRTTPELLPALEKNMARYRGLFLSFYDLGSDFSSSVDFEKSTLRHIVLMPVMLVVFAISNLYRYTIKLSALFYLPMLVMSQAVPDKLASYKKKLLYAEKCPWFCLSILAVFAAIAFVPDSSIAEQYIEIAKKEKYFAPLVGLPEKQWLSDLINHFSVAVVVFFSINLFFAALFWLVERKATHSKEPSKEVIANGQKVLWGYTLISGFAYIHLVWSALSFVLPLLSPLEFIQNAIS